MCKRWLAWKKNQGCRPPRESSRTYQRNQRSLLKISQRIDHAIFCLHPQPTASVSCSSPPRPTHLRRFRRLEVHRILLFLRQRVDGFGMRDMSLPPLSGQLLRFSTEKVFGEVLASQVPRQCLLRTCEEHLLPDRRRIGDVGDCCEFRDIIVGSKKNVEGLIGLQVGL